MKTHFLSATQDLYCSKMGIHYHDQAHHKSSLAPEKLVCFRTMWLQSEELAGFLTWAVCTVPDAAQPWLQWQQESGLGLLFQRRSLGRHTDASWIQQIQEGRSRRLVTQGNIAWVWNYWDVPSMVIRDLQITRKVSSSEWVQQSSAASFQTSHTHPGLVWLSELLGSEC